MCSKCGRFKQTRCAHCDADAASAELTALRARLEAAERVVEAVRAYNATEAAEEWEIRVHALGQMTKALAAYDDAKAGGGA
jgi:hypothetical protein